jgi:hypothetical protein
MPWMGIFMGMTYHTPGLVYIQDMTAAQLKVLAHLLDKAASEFSNHGCNDLHLDRLGLTTEELASFKENYIRYVDDGEESGEAGNCVQDWLVMRYLAHIAKQEVSNPLKSEKT